MGQRIAAGVGRLIIGACVVTSLCGAARVVRAELVFCCRADNDLFKLMPSSPRFDHAADAIGHAADGDALLILADDYPKTRTSVPDDLFARAAAKRLRLY